MRSPGRPKGRVTQLSRSAKHEGGNHTSPTGRPKDRVTQLSQSAEDEGKPSGYVVGLTGGIGSGKSAVARAFADLGADVADADDAARVVSARGSQGMRAVAAAFGASVVAPDGELDRAQLRRIVFNDPEARRQLEGILHPLIRIELARQMAAWRGPYGLLVVPLLLERGTHMSQIARILVVDCPEEEQVRRVELRSGIAPAEVRAIMATQLTRAQRTARADDIIDNSAALSALPPQVARLDGAYREYAALAAQNA